MRNLILKLALTTGVGVAFGCSGPTSGAASLGLAPTVAGAPLSGLQFGPIGSALSYTGVWLLPQPDGSNADAGPALSVELYDTGPGVACFQQFTQETPYIADAGPAAEDNASLEVSPGQWAAWLDFAGFPNAGLAAGTVPLVPAAFGAGISGLGATLSIEQIDGSEILSVGGSVVVQSASSSNVTGTFNGTGQNVTVIAAAQSNDVAAVFAAGLDDPLFDADADAGNSGAFYQDALNDALDAGATGAPLAAALLADPDAGGSFTLQGSFNAPTCVTPYVPGP